MTGKLVKLLERLKNREVSPDYTYYGIASPWLQVRWVLHPEPKASPGRMRT